MIEKRLSILVGLTFCLCYVIDAQPYSRQDSLRGTITAERVWWDLKYYHLDISVDVESKSIFGKNTIHYQVINEGRKLQVDLQPPMTLDSVLQNGIRRNIEHEVNAHFIDLTQNQKRDSIYQLELFYSGKPREAVNAPWDGGIVWTKDEKGQPFIASACQGIGASTWWPCKDHPYDEPDSMLISVTVPKDLTNVSNGRLRKVDQYNDSKTFHWFVSNPINSYGVNINIGNYVNFSEVYEGEGGLLDMDYYVLEHNLKKAKKQFTQAKETIEAFEYWFGSYPFYEDSYKLVEVPYLGMEHQSSVTYGNGYQNGYKGTDLSDTGWGLKFDFIIVHETGHEWFANSLTNRDVADMWIHESFTNYSESLFLEYHHGKEAGHEYVIGCRKRISNDRPIIGDYDVNQPGSHDMYYKGGNMLHTLRQLVDDDERWREILRSLNSKFYHQVISSEQVENYLSEKTEIDLGSFFDQYLRDSRMPTLEYYFKDNTLFARWSNCISGFDMPIQVKINDAAEYLNPTTEWAVMPIKTTLKETNKLIVDTNFYVGKVEVVSD